MVLLFHVSGLFALFQALMGYVKGADIYRAPSMLVRPGLPLVLCIVGASGNEETRIMSSLGEVLTWTGKGIFVVYSESGSICVNCRLPGC